MRRFNSSGKHRQADQHRRDHSRRHGRPDHSREGYRQGPIRDEAEERFFRTVAVDPTPRIRLEKGSSEITMRAMDLLTPIGMGQRGLIVAPPGSGKTTFLQHICRSVTKAYPEIKLYVLLIDERPEEVTDFRRSVEAEVCWSSCDETYDHHVQTARELMKQVYREAEAGENVMVVIDSLTRLARVHNAESRSSGRTLSGGVDARALEIPRRIFGSARKVENGGSLTILATILVDTGSRMDQVIFEEFKGTGNMEIVLKRELSNQRLYPAIDIKASRTRKEELLFEPDEFEQVTRMRRALDGLGLIEATGALIKQLEKHPTNESFLAAIAGHGQ